MTQDNHPLHPFFHPKSIAVVGASADPTKLGGRTFRNLREYGYGGRLYPVNARAERIQGVEAVPSVADLPDGVDLALVLVPAPAVEEAVAACVEKGIPAAIVFSSGFAEVGSVEEQKRLVSIARAGNTRIIGPNCMGVLNVHENQWGTFTTSFDHGLVKPGRMAVVSQSGAFGAHCFGLAREAGLGLSLWATTGNEGDVDVGEILSYYAMDSRTEVVLAYLEGAKDKERLEAGLEACRVAKKPVVVLKVGSSEVGALAATSHTASLVGSDGVYDAVFRSYGVHRAETIGELMDMGYAALGGTLPSGKRVGLVTISGGVGVHMADEASRRGLEVPEMPAETQEKLKALLPYAAVRNPVDTTAMALAHPHLIEKNLELMLEEGGCDSVVLFLAGVGLSKQVMGKLIGPLETLLERYPHGLMVVSTMCSPEMRERLEAVGYLVFTDPARAVEAVAVLHRFKEAFERPARVMPQLPPPITSPAAKTNHSIQTLMEHEAMAILAQAGVPVVEQRLVTSAEEATVAAIDLGWPVVMKIASPDIPHKSEAGGVLLGVADVESAQAGYEALMDNGRKYDPEARLSGVVVARQLSGGVETIIGVSRDPVFGPVVMFGLGGVFVEVMQDIALRVAPFGVKEAREMIREIKGYPLLAGVRGQPPADVEALAETLAKLSQFAAANKDWLETMDINPFLVMPKGQGAVALDALLMTSKSEPSSNA